MRTHRNHAAVLVVDDDEGFRAFACETLARAGFSVSGAGTADEALTAAEQRPPALALLDVRLPVTSGYALCRRLRERFDSAIGIIFVSGERTEPFDRVAGLLIGADDYVTKPVAPEELAARAEAVVRRVPSAGAANVSSSPLRGLTRRELEVLRLLADGLRQSAIAERLVISPRTVATHIEHILEKLGAHSRAEAVALAYREDLLDSPA